MKIEDFYSSFSFKQIMLVNSGKYCYVKVPLNEHICLLGANNGGKSSILNSMKFFLLPEENLHHCEHKFGFKNPNGFYGRDSTYQFYFPERNSFLILEAENPHGPFCIVLNQGSKPFSYERTGVPCAFSEIEHLFWNVHSPLNGGQGAPVGGLGIKSVAAELKKMGGVSIRDAANIRERLYKHQHNRPDLGRYCLLPLKSGGTKQREVDAWKRLIHLSFDIGAKDRRTLPDTIATIIEGRKARAEAEVQVNFGEILARYQRLRTTQDRLQTISNGERYWNAYNEGFTELSSRSSLLLNLLLDAQDNVEQVKAQLEGAREQRAAEYASRHESSREIARDVERLQAQYNECRGRVSSARQAFERSRDEAIELGATRTGYAGMSLEEVLEIRLEALEEARLDLETCRDKATLRSEFEERNREIKRLRPLIESADQWIRNRSTSVLDLLNEQTADRLYSLNAQAFSVECEVLEPATREVIKRFADLFSIEGHQLGFLGKSTGIPLQSYSAAELLERKQVELGSLTVQLRKAQARYNELSTRVTESDEKLALRSQELQDLIVRDTRAISLLKSAERIDADLRRHEGEYEAVQEQLTLLDGQAAEAGARLTEARAQSDAAASALERAKKESDDVIQWTHRIKDMHLRLGLFNNGFQRQAPQEVLVNQALIDDMDHQSRNLVALMQVTCKHVSDLLDAVPLDDKSPEQAHRAAYELSDLRQLHERYALLYARLATEEDNLFHQVAAHNADTDIQMRQIRATKTLITDFIREIEEHLKSIRISNIEEIHIGYTLHPQFDELLSVLEAVNMSGGELPPQVLYDRLGSFFTQFFESDQRRDATLNLAQLINSVEYRVRLIGREDFKVEAQSTGTSVMINIRVLAFLLKELLQSDTKVSMPLLIDEISQLDVANLKSAREIAEADGFRIFGATPEWTPAIGKVIGTFMNLSYFEAVDEYYNAERTIVFTGECESLIPVAPGSEQTFTRPGPGFELEAEAPAE
jgi:energy-coupling factor transporter ATP-binding protein EcfA2